MVRCRPLDQEKVSAFPLTPITLCMVPNEQRRDQLGHGFTGPCANHEHAALVALDATRLRKRHREDEHTGGSFEGQLSALESRIRDLPSYVLSKQSDEPNKRPRNRKTNSTNGDRRQYWNTQAAIEEEASRIEQTLDDLVGSAPEDKKDDVVMIKSLCSSAFATARFVNIVKDRVAALRDKADAQVEVPMPLAQMFGYLRQWKTTGPTGFHNVLEGSARLVEALGSVRQGLARESAGLKKFRTWILSQNPLLKLSRNVSRSAFLVIFRSYTFRQC
ncbi:hypothetical protein LZ30DRAFT_347822 [Colletotrichum cereale]|nr:hypothetical protein LZ30DRAFT_347822 [Colletotrichum cereale]